MIFQLKKDFFRQTKSERIHHHQPYTIENVKGSTWQKKNNARQKYGSIQNNGKHVGKYKTYFTATKKEKNVIDYLKQKY